MRTRGAIAAATIALSVHAGLATAGDVEPPAPAAPFTKTALSGGEVSLSDFDGGILVLFLFGYG